MSELAKIEGDARPATNLQLYLFLVIPAPILVFGAAAALYLEAAIFFQGVLFCL